MAGDPFFPQVLTQQSAVGTLKSSFTTAASIINQTELVSLPVNFFRVGRRIRVSAFGGLSNVVTAQPTFTFQVMMGTIAVFTTGAITTNATANTLLPIDIVVDLRVDSIGTGTAAKWVGRAKIECDAFAALSVSRLWPTTAPAVGTGFDSTISNLLDFYAACQTSAAGNAIQLYDYTVEILQ